jgi:NAD(P)-dependent dehydrogenase (short-subunit alcohol dehydrogenase family)
LSDPRTRVDTAGSNHLDAFRLDERVALITGACSEGGIGREIGLAPAAAGASVGLADVNEDGIRAATRRLQATGGEAVPLRIDVTDPESVSTAVITLK